MQDIILQLKLYMQCLRNENYHKGLELFNDRLESCSRLKGIISKKKKTNKNVVHPISKVHLFSSCCISSLNTHMHTRTHMHTHKSALFCLRHRNRNKRALNKIKKAAEIDLVYVQRFIILPCLQGECILGKAVKMYKVHIRMQI